VLRPIILIAALCTLLQEQEKVELTVEQELAALIEKTNALETFHVFYELSMTGETETATVELVYRAPDLGRMRFSASGKEADAWFSGRDIYSHVDGSWRKATVAESPVAELLDDLFPPEPTALAPGVALLLRLGSDSSGKPELSFSFMTAYNGRSSALLWLTDMQRRASQIFVEGNFLGWESEGYRCLVSRATGFIEQVELTSADGRGALRLREAHFGEKLDPSLVALPAEARDAPIDEATTRSFDQALGPEMTRRGGFLRVELQLETKKREWNELARNDWRTFLGALHRKMIEQRYAGWLDQLEKDSDELAERVRTQLSKDDSPERRAALKEEMTRFRVPFEARLEKAAAKYKALPPIESTKVTPRQELFDIELEVVDALCEELIRKPALASFDEKIAAAFRD
jgi:hypothetical protein